MEKFQTGNLERNADQNTSDNQGWADLEKLNAKFEFNEHGDAIFTKLGDRISFGTTPNTLPVDEFPQGGSPNYEGSIVGIETFSGDRYYINQGIFLDKKNDKKVDILQKRVAAQKQGGVYVFPDIIIGSRLPYEKISPNLPIPEGERGTVLKVICYGVGESAIPEHKTMNEIHDFFRDMIRQNDKAREVRGYGKRKQIGIFDKGY